MNCTHIYQQSILDFACDYPREFVLIEGVLIYLNPESLSNVYDILYHTSKRYICIAEYYNPTPVEVLYRGNTGKIFKRDFAGEMMDRYPNLVLVDYGFQYHRDRCFPLDDITWFLLEKSRIRYGELTGYMSSIAIITARGGSKRIPNKNIRDFCGKPIMAYSIESAIQSSIFDEVLVSTDSAEIAEIAQKYGANVPFFRSAEMSNDYAVTADVLKEVLCDYKRIGRNFDILCCIYPTAPFVTADKLRNAMELLESTDTDSVMPVVQFSFPPQRGLLICEGKLHYEFPEHEKSRSQDLEPIYHDCGQFYAAKTEAFLRYGTLVTPNTAPLVMPEQEVQDIDNLSDWELAEIKYKRFILKEA